MSDMPTILPANSQRTEYNLEQLSGRLIGLDAPIYKLWSADNCPAELLGYLAWSFSVEVWDPSWTEAQRRAVLKESVTIHRLKGTVGAVRRALEAIGFTLGIVEWWEDGSPVHTFKVTASTETLTGAGLQADAALLALITKQIEDVKPARSHFTVEVAEEFRVEAFFVNGVQEKLQECIDHDVVVRFADLSSTAYFRNGLREGSASYETHEIHRRIA